MIHKITLALSLLIATAVITPSVAEVKFHTGSTEELYQKAKSQNRFVFIDLYAEWCPPCRAMESNVFSREDVGAFMAESFVSAKYNVDDKIGNRLSAQYEVRSIPTYLIFTPNGELIGRMTGGMSAEDFMSRVGQFIEK